MIIRLICASGDLLEAAGVYYETLDVLDARPFVGGYVTLEPWEWERVGDDPDGAVVYEERAA